MLSYNLRFWHGPAMRRSTLSGFIILAHHVEVEGVRQRLHFAIC